MMVGYCEKHHRPYLIKWVGGEWVHECPDCRAEGLLDIYIDKVSGGRDKVKWE